MSEHLKYVTHIDNKEDEVYLRSKHFPVNMRLFHSSPQYKSIILSICDYIRERCLNEVEGYKKPHGMSSANLGLSFNIIGVTRNRNQPDEYCQIMINPEIIQASEEMIQTSSNCGSLTLPENINVLRHTHILVSYFDEQGRDVSDIFDRNRAGFSIQHEIDHNNGILIIDREVK